MNDGEPSPPRDERYHLAPTWGRDEELQGIMTTSPSREVSTSLAKPGYWRSRTIWEDYEEGDQGEECTRQDDRAFYLTRFNKVYL